jgi:hypothetical protein
MPETLLGFGFSGSGLDHVLDTATGVVGVPRLPLGYSAQRYRRWETTPFYGDALRVADRVIIGVGPKAGAAPWRLYSIPSDFGAGKMLRLPAGDYFASKDGDNVWITSEDRGASRTAIERNPDDGAVVRGPITLKSHQQLIAAVDNGLLSERVDKWPGAELDLLDPATGAVERVITRAATSDQAVLGAAGDLVVWQGPAGCEICQIHISNLRTLRTRVVSWPAPQRFLCDSAALSPDTRWLAVSYGCPRPDFSGRAPVVVVNTSTGRGHIVPGSAETDGSAPIWTADSRWLIWQDDRVLAYRIGARRPHLLATPGGVMSELLQGWASRAG